MKSLHDLAKNNSTALEKHIQELPNQDWAQNFLNAVASVHFVSTNVKLPTITKILEGGFIKDMYQVIKEERDRLKAKGEPVPSSDEMAKELDERIRRAKENFHKLFFRHKIIYLCCP